MTPGSLVIKQGATLRIAIAYQADDGSTPDLTGAVVTSDVVTASGNLVGSIAITPTDVIGTYTGVVLDTSAWPVGRLLTDIRITLPDGTVDLSDTMAIVVEPAMTPKAVAP